MSENSEKSQFFITARGDVFILLLLAGLGYFTFYSLSNKKKTSLYYDGKSWEYDDSLTNLL